MRLVLPVGHYLLLSLVVVSSPPSVGPSAAEQLSKQAVMQPERMFSIVHLQKCLRVLADIRNSLGMLIYHFLGPPPAPAASGSPRSSPWITERVLY